MSYSIRKKNYLNMYLYSGNIHNTLVNLPNSSASLDSNRKPVHISLSTRFTTSNTLATLYDNNIVNFTPIIP